MQTKTSLKIDWATHEAAKYACENWHYSRCMPVGKIVKIGAWESGKFIGVVLFSRGAAPNLLKRYGLTQFEGCELTRVALTKHLTPVSRILSVSIRFLKQQSPGLRLIVSFADPSQGHHGGIYQATNWTFNGYQAEGGAREYLIDGKWVHTKSASIKFGTQSSAEIAKRYPHIKMRKVTRKLRYLMPLDAEMRAKIVPLAKPYPKRAGSRDNAAPDFQSGEGGAIPTPALQLNDLQTV